MSYHVFEVWVYYRAILIHRIDAAIRLFPIAAYAFAAGPTDFESTNQRIDPRILERH